MISARSFDPDMGYAGLLMRADEYAALGETTERYELINGVVVMSPSQLPRHWTLVDLVLRQLHEHGHRREIAEGYATYAGIDLFIDDLTVYRPDLCAYSRPRTTDDPPRLTTPPDLVLEVISRGGKPLDLVTKRDAYERFGVKEYWTINPDEPDCVKAWSRQQGRFVDNLATENSLASTAFPGFALDLTAIRARATRQ